MLFFYAQGNDITSIVAANGIRILQGIIHLCNIGQMDDIPVCQRNSHGLQAFRIVIVIAHTDIQVLFSDLYLTCRNGKIRCSHDLAHCRHGEMILLQFFRYQFHPDIAFLAAGQGHLAHGPQFFKQWDHIVVHICIKVSVHLPADRQGHHRLGVQVQFHNGGFIGIIRQIAADAVHGLFQIDIGCINIGSVFILDHDHRYIFLGVGLYCVHTVQGCDGILLLHGDQFIDIIRACPCIHGTDDQHGQLHLRGQLNLGS